MNTMLLEIARAVGKRRNLGGVVASADSSQPSESSKSDEE